MSITRQLYPLVSVDVSLFCVEEDRLKVLLARRANEPMRHQWSLPGGLLKPEHDASLEEAAWRVLREKIDVRVPHLAQVTSFSGPDRDPRGWSVATLFYALLPRDLIQAASKYKVEEVAWVDAMQPGLPLAFDHAKLLASAIQRLQQRVTAGDLPLHLLPEVFTLTELQRTCEAILDHAFDKSSFRRQLQDARDLEATGEKRGGHQRPAALYRAAAAFAWD